MGQALVGAVLVEESPEFEFVGGLFYAHHADGIVRVYRPNTFFAMVAAAASESRKFKSGGAEIIPFPKSDDARH
jgi:hypothetical protein